MIINVAKITKKSHRIDVTFIVKYKYFILQSGIMQSV